MNCVTRFRLTNFEELAHQNQTVLLNSGGIDCIEVMHKSDLHSLILPFKTKDKRYKITYITLVWLKKKTAREGMSQQTCHGRPHLK